MPNRVLRHGLCVRNSTSSMSVHQGEDLEELFNDEEYSDFTILCGEEGTDQKTFHVHKAILARRSDYFKVLCSKKFSEGQENRVTMQECHPDQLETMLRYCYTDRYCWKIDTNNNDNGDDRNDDKITPPQVLRVHAESYRCASYLQMPALKLMIIAEMTSFLKTGIKYKKPWDIDDLAEAFKILFESPGEEDRKMYGDLLAVVVERHEILLADATFRSCVWRNHAFCYTLLLALSKSNRSTTPESQPAKSWY